MEILAESSQGHALIIQLMIGYAIAGGFIAILILSILSLTPLRVIKDRKQQKILFSALILELVAGVLAYGLGWLNPNRVTESFDEQLKEQVVAVKNKATATNEEKMLQIAELEQRAKKYRIAASSLDQKKKELEDELKEQKERLAAVEKQMQESIAQSGKLEQYISEYIDEVGSLAQVKGILRANKRNIEELEEEREVLEAELNNLTQQHQEAQARIAELENR